MTNFRNALGNLRWNSVYTTDDVNLSFENFWDTFSMLYDLHFPLAKVKPNRNIHSLNDFMTSALLVSRRRKLDLHKLSIINPAAYLAPYKPTETFLIQPFVQAKYSIMIPNFAYMPKTPKKHGIP
jgi:hypothetical protein